MKIAIISDFHLGAKEGTLREKDPFDQAREAFEKALSMGAQLILIPGDIFDSRIPKQEVWSEAMKILSLASEGKNEDISIDRTIKRDKENITVLPLRGVPVIAIHGNHERRGKGFVDSIEALESAGLLIRLHHSGIVLNSPEGKVAIQGMGYAPEEYAIDLLNKWKPDPVENAFNIFLLHQGLGQFTYSSADESRLKPADLLEGSDLYVSGHVHYKIEDEVFGRPLIFPGSTFRTQLLPIEAENPKGFYMVELDEDEVDYYFVRLNSVRDFFYEEKEFNQATHGEVEDWIRNKVRDFLERELHNPDKIPLARLRLLGTLAKGSSRSEIGFSEIKEEFEDKIILAITGEDLSSSELDEKAQFLKDIREEKVSMEERGLRVLKSNLENLDYDERFDVDELYNLLSNDRVDDAIAKISEKIDCLTESELGVEE